MAVGCVSQAYEGKPLSHGQFPGSAEDKGPPARGCSLGGGCGHYLSGYGDRTCNVSSSQEEGFTRAHDFGGFSLSFVTSLVLSE